MSIVLTRIDDRLIHGQVVVGWAQALGAKRIVLVDDQVSASEWERELYAVGVPPGLEVVFASVVEAAESIGGWSADGTRTILLLGDIASAVRLCERAPGIHKVNLGGLHEHDGRSQRLPYVFLTSDEVAQLQQLAERGVEITAQDVPTARAVPLGSLG